MKKNFKIFISLAATVVYIVLACGCKSTSFYYQVFDVQTDNLQNKNDMLVYEGSDVNIVYNLWAESGSLSFVFENKTNNDLYFLTEKSHLIQNGFSLDYYDPNDYTSSVTSTYSNTETSNATLYGYAKIKGSLYPANIGRASTVSSATAHTNSVTRHGVKYICIPAHSSRVITGFNITNNVQLDCDATSKNFPKTKSSTVTYTKDNSPMVMRNIIAYSADPESKKIEKVENTMWISAYTNYSQTSMLESVKRVDCTTGQRLYGNVLLSMGANCFYNTYNSTTDRGTKPVASKK